MKANPLSIGLTLLSLYLPSSINAENASFIRGDSNRDQKVNLSDAIFTIMHLFSGKTAHCFDALDFNDDGIINLSDGVTTLSFIFLNAPAPPQPFPSCGKDETLDELSCEVACPTKGLYFVAQRSLEDEITIFIELKNQIKKAITQLSPDDEFAIVFFDVNSLQWPSQEEPALATEANKIAALDFIDSTPAEFGDCVGSGLITALDYIDHSASEERSIILFHDGSGTCPGNREDLYLDHTLGEVKTRNIDPIPIHCVQLNLASSSFHNELASSSNGSVQYIYDLESN